MTYSIWYPVELTPYDKCDFIPCRTNVDASDNPDNRSRLKYCQGCFISRYCSAQCQRADWQYHKLLCKRHKFYKRMLGPEWSTTVDKISQWHRIHHAALRDAFVAFLRNLNATLSPHAQAALHVVLRHHSSADLAKCMDVAEVHTIKIGVRASMETPWLELAQARDHYDAQLSQVAPDDFIGAGILMLTVKQDEDVGDDANYAVVLPVPPSRPAGGPADISESHWDALLKLRLHEGKYMDPREADVRERLENMYTLGQALRQSPQTWITLSIADSITLKGMLSSTFLTKFKRYTSDERRHIIARMEGIIEVIRNGTREEKTSIGVYDVKRDMEEWIKQKYPDWEDDSVLDACYWQLVRLYRFSFPTRIADAEAAIHWILKTHQELNPGSVDCLPIGMLAVAIQHKPSRELEAEVMFATALTMPLERLAGSSRRPDVTYLVEDTEMWLRANYSRLLRRLGKVEEAARQEALIVECLRTMSRAISPSYARLLLRDEHDLHAPNPLFEHPYVRSLLHRPEVVGVFVPPTPRVR